jgi:formate hydrogenlyase subunit 3/multisubunit Na+/H+ antiporter MnhD subunit
LRLPVVALVGVVSGLGCIAIGEIGVRMLGDGREVWGWLMFAIGGLCVVVGVLILIGLASGVK